MPAFPVPSLLCLRSCAFAPVPSLLCLRDWHSQKITLTISSKLTRPDPKDMANAVEDAASGS